MMLRIGICDDSADARDALYLQLEKIIIEGAEEVVYEFSSGVSAMRWLKGHPGEIDLLFLDVEMEGMNGMETAKEIRRFDQGLILVFLTGYPDYVFDGYQVGAFDYLIKPAKNEQLQELLHRVRKWMYEQRENCYTMKNAQGMFRFPMAEIAYFYSDKRKVTLFYQEKEYAFYGKLDEVEKEVSAFFVRIHQRYLVNPRFVTYVGADQVALGETMLPMSRGLKETAKAKLAKAMLEEF